MMDKDYVTTSNTYKKILIHRHNCRHWKSGTLCLECFGGGLTRFFEDLIREREGIEL